MNPVLYNGTENPGLTAGRVDDNYGTERRVDKISLKFGRVVAS